MSRGALVALGVASLTGCWDFDRLSAEAACRNGVGPCPGADAGGGTFCEAVDAAFCADFDRAGPFDAGFAIEVARGGATLERSVTDFASPPASLLIRLPAADGGFTTAAFLSAVLPVSAPVHRTVTVEFSFRADEARAGRVQFLTANLNGASATGAVSLSRTDGRWGLTVGLRGISATFFGTPDGGLGSVGTEFQRLSLEATFARDAGVARLYLGGALLVETPPLTTSLEMMPTTMEVQLMAASARDQTPAGATRYDDVVIRTAP